MAPRARRGHIGASMAQERLANAFGARLAMELFGREAPRSGSSPTPNRRAI
jgi:hypothetical protein